MPATAHLRPWRLVPSHAINGIAVAVGIGLIQALFGVAAGAYPAQLVVSGATCASLADVPNRVARTAQRVAVAAALSFAAALSVDLLRPHPLALGIAVALIAFAAMMVLSWGARVGAVAFAPILSMVFSMAVPPTAHPFAVAGWSACGGVAFLAWSVIAGAACQRRYRTLALAGALRAAAELFRSRARVLEARRRKDGDEAPLRAWIQGETLLAERLQAARDFVFPATSNTLWHRDTAILLRVIELRDLLLASPLDLELLGSDRTARAILAQVADALHEVGGQIDLAADDIRDGRVAQAGKLARVDFAARLAAVRTPEGDPRARLVPALVRRQQRMADEVAHVHRLLQGHDRDVLPLSMAQLQQFVSREVWAWRELRAQCQLDSLVLRHAIRMGLALGAAHYIELALPWGTHPYWLVLSVAVVLRGTLGDTLARRNARVAGTLLGCLVVVALAALPSLDFQRGMYLVALGTAHAFATQRYWLTATAASVMALLQSSLVNSAGGFAIAERLADTVIGALLAWSFSYVLPSWERRGAAQVIANIFANLASYGAHALDAKSGDAVEERLLRRKAYDSLASLGGALQRSSVEPQRVRLPVEPIAALLDHGGRLMAHVAVVRVLRAQLDGRAEAPAVAAMLAEAHAALSAHLDLGRPAPPADAVDIAPGSDLVPTYPPADDVVPWLARRLRLMLHDAALMRQAANAVRDAAGTASSATAGLARR
jgi:uncharacterized membrane protein YccC